VYTRLFSSFKPRIIYNNSWLNKSNVLKENRGKSGVYRWVNKLNNETYIGSSINLTNRLGEYYSKKYLKYKSNNSRINRALLKYGYENFDLEILEYCNKENVINREQYYLDLLNPEYNILKIAGSSLGFKHSSYSKLIMSNLKIGERNNMFNKKHTKRTRESISLTMKGRPKLFVHVVTDITRAKISKAHRGKR
jgi:group I intron endonuclease